MNDADILKAVHQIVESGVGAASMLAQVVKLLHAEKPHYHWVGVYLLHGQELVLGPYVGKPTVHTRIPLNQGICGAAASTGETIVVDDVNANCRYLACSLDTRSEIVSPIRNGSRVLGEIDIDSDQPAAFGDDDRRLLEAIACSLGQSSAMASAA